MRKVTPSAPTARTIRPRFQKLPVDRLRWEIDQGIADVSAALGDNRELAPFFRIPGLARTDIIERELSARSLVVFSSDTVADDWHRRIRPKDIISRAISRLEARGKGILLLHDIHQSTVLALPGLFKELKDKGFHIVHVVAGSGHAVETASVPPWINDRSDPSWPQNLSGPESNRIALPVPDAKSFDTGYLPRQKVMLADRTAGAAYLASAGATDWSDPSKTETAARRAPPAGTRRAGYRPGAGRMADGSRTHPAGIAAAGRAFRRGSTPAGQIVRKRLEIGIGQIVSDLAHRGHAGTDARPGFEIAQRFEQNVFALAGQARGGAEAVVIVGVA